MKIFLSLLVLGPLLCAAEPVIDIYVSTGDNHFLGSSLPIDSPASIEVTFDLFKEVNHARRIYWRGLEAACWIATISARPENPRYHSYWEWLTHLYTTVKPDELATKAAHARGMEIWGMGSLFDWGSHPDTPGFNDYPFCFGEFGYSDPIVEDFKKMFKVDLRTEPFRRGASREDWLRLRGSYVTAFLRELKAALAPHHIKLGMVVNSNDPRQPQSWNVPELTITAGSHHMDVDTWVREELVDELEISLLRASEGGDEIVHFLRLPFGYIQHRQC